MRLWICAAAVKGLLAVALGAVVPLGGILLLGGWAALFVHGWGLRGRIER